MAMNPLGADSAHVTPMPAALPSPGALAAVLLSYPSEHLEALTEALVATLDVQDAPHTEDEPDFRSRSDGLPGDPADHEPGGDEEAGAYVEWDTKTPAQRKAGVELGPNGATSLGFGQHEDDEEDDPAEDDDSDRCAAGDDHMISGAVATKSQSTVATS